MKLDYTFERQLMLEREESWKEGWREGVKIGREESSIQGWLS